MAKLLIRFIGFCLAIVWCKRGQRLCVVGLCRPEGRSGSGSSWSLYPRGILAAFQVKHLHRRCGVGAGSLKGLHGSFEPGLASAAAPGTPHRCSLWASQAEPQPCRFWKAEVSCSVNLGCTCLPCTSCFLPPAPLFPLHFSPIFQGVGGHLPSLGISCPYYTLPTAFCG